METIALNISGKTRNATLAGRKYVVAPATLIVPGVLNGSQGPLYYPPDEIGRRPTDWNNVPMVVDHPTENGQQVSARNPLVAEKQQVGTIYNAEIKNEKLIAELWFDVEATERVDNRIMQSLKAGQAIELSTGLYTENEPAEEGATYNGVSYTHVARNYRPDHLAILPDQTGACSVQDGCGVLINRNAVEDIVMSKLKEEEKKKIVDDLIANNCCWEEADRDTLNALDDDKLNALKANAEKEEQRAAVANAAMKGFTDSSGNEHTWNEQKRVWETKERKEKTVANEDKDKGKKEDKPQTAEEWMETAPPEIQSAVRNAMSIEAKEKAEIIEKLLVNITDEDRPAQTERLQRRGLEELRGDLTLLPKPPKQLLAANYVGAAGAVGSAGPKLTPMGLPGEYE